MSKLSKIILPFFILVSIFFNVAPALAQGPLVGKFIPKCVIDPPTGNHPEDGSEGQCRSISIFVILLLNVANYLFTIVGALALLFFIYGGFMLILSQGKSEQLQKGKEIILAAVIGLIIVFSAYMLVSFLGEAIGLKKEFMLNP